MTRVQWYYLPNLDLSTEKMFYLSLEVRIDMLYILLIGNLANWGEV